MNIIYLTILLAPLIIIIHIVMIWVFNTSKYAIKMMFVSFLIYLFICLFFAIFFYDTNFLNYKDYLACFCVIAFFCLGYMEFFSMLCRGFSLRIITDIYIRQSISAEKMISEYADGKGIDWMFNKRLNDMSKLKLISFNGKDLSLIYPQGHFCSYASSLIKKILNLKKGGE